MNLTKALLVFCEGAHDVAYVAKIFKVFFGASKRELKFSEYPSPLGSLFRENVESHAAQDLTLDMAHKFYLPDRILSKDNHLILLFNNGGKDSVSKVKVFLEQFLTLVPYAEVFREDASSAIKDTQYLFLYDADHQRPHEVIRWAEETYKVVKNSDWQLSFSDVSTGSISAKSGNKAVYIWSEAADVGTLEDILLPMCRKSKPGFVSEAEKYIGQTFTWETNATDKKHACAEKAKRQKAILTAAGQRDKPGGSLFSILDQTGILDETSMLNSLESKAFAIFLKEFAGLECNVGLSPDMS